MAAVSTPSMDWMSLLTEKWALSGWMCSFSSSTVGYSVYENTHTTRTGTTAMLSAGTAISTVSHPPNRKTHDMFSVVSVIILFYHIDTHWFLKNQFSVILMVLSHVNTDNARQCYSDTWRWYLNDYIKILKMVLGHISKFTRSGKTNQVSDESWFSLERSPRYRKANDFRNVKTHSWHCDHL